MFPKTLLRQSSRIVTLIETTMRRPKDPLLSYGSCLLRSHIESATDSDSSRPLDIGQCAFSLRDVGPKLTLEMFNELIPRIEVESDLLFGLFCWNEANVCDLISLIREQGFTNRIILGGPQVTFSENPSLEYPDADVYVRGYGEQALTEFYNSTPVDDIPGIFTCEVGDDGSYASQNASEMSSSISPILNDLYPIYDHDQEPFSNGHFMRLETKRGCLYSCDYCAHDSGDRQQNIIEFDLVRLEEEISKICSHDIRSISVIDPIFNYSPTNHHLSVLDMFISRGDDCQLEKLAFQCKIEHLDSIFLDRIFELAEHVDEVFLEIGIQSLHENELRHIGRSPVKKDEYSELVERVKRRNNINEGRKGKVWLKFDVIYGLPGQTVESFQEVVEWCVEQMKRNERVRVAAWPLMALKGTKLDRRREMWKLKVNEDCTVVASDTFDEEQYAKMERMAMNLMTKNPK